MQRFIHPRRIDWQQRLALFLSDSQRLGPDLTIDWDSEGTTCFSWVGMGIEEMTGFNPHDQFVGKYDGVLGACKYMKSIGYSCFDNVIADMFQEVPISMAQFGDIALVPYTVWLDEDGDGQEIFAEEMMPHGITLVEPPFYYGISNRGLVKGDLYAHAHRAFAVGREI